MPAPILTARRTLSDTEVHLWYVLPDSLTDPALMQACARVLSPDERERWQRFKFEEGRQLYLISHGFLRFVLSRYADVAPHEWRFIRNGYGKPEVQPPPGREGLRSLSFNLTHTNGLAACAVTREREIGVDAEDVERRGREVSEDLIRYCLSAAEKRCFEALPPEQRKSAFFDYWTLKEAYLKARGFGLSLPVEAITFRWTSGVPHQGAVEAEFAPDIMDSPRTWQFERFLPTARHKLGVAVRRPAGPPLSVSLRQFHF